MRTTAIFHLAEVTGPAQTLRPRLARLAAAGQLDVVVPGPGAADDLYASLGDVTQLPYEAIVVPGSPVAAIRAAGGQARAVAAFRRHFRARRPDLVVVVSALLPAALVAARLERVPALVYVGEILDKGFVSSAVRRAGARAIVRTTAALARAIVCASNTVARQFDGARAHVSTIYPGISTAFAEGNAQRFRERHGLDGSGPLVTVVGNLSAGRGQDLAVEALALLRPDFPEAGLVLAGEPHPRPVDRLYRDELRVLTRARGVADAVTFAGFVDPVADAYAASAVVVNPARTNEGFGRVAFEALAAGKPVVATRVGAIPEVLEDEREALLVPPDDAEEIAAAVARLLREPELARGIAARGRKRALAELDEERGADRFTEVVTDVLGRPIF